MGTQVDLTLSGAPDLIAFDLETTGTDPKADRIVEIGIVRRIEGQTSEHRWLINPETAIATEATEVHGISNADVADAPRFAQVWREIEHVLDGPAPLLAFNGLDFDLPMLNAEIGRLHPMEGASERSPALTFKPEGCGRVMETGPVRLLDPLVFVRWNHRHRRFRKLEDMCRAFGITLTNAHSAVDDARATMALTDELMVRGDMPSSTEDAIRAQASLVPRIDEERAKFSYWLYFDRKTAAVRMGAGKFCGKLLANVDPGYLDFLLRKVDDLPAEVRTRFEQVTA